MVRRNREDDDDDEDQPKRPSFEGQVIFKGDFSDDEDRRELNDDE